jgi:hypothetical protein
VCEAAVERATLNIALEVGANEVGQAGTVEAMLDGCV